MAPVSPTVTQAPFLATGYVHITNSERRKHPLCGGERRQVQAVRILHRPIDGDLRIERGQEAGLLVEHSGIDQSNMGPRELACRSAPDRQ